MSFKLIGIRPLESETKRFSKNLVQGKIYKFCNDYIFYTESGVEINDDSTEKIISYKKKKSSVPAELYKIKESKHDISIQVSALVGKNGSGKSTILELLYAFCYLTSLEVEILNGISYFEDEKKRLNIAITCKLVEIDEKEEGKSKYKTECEIDRVKSELVELRNDYDRIIKEQNNCLQQIDNINSLKKDFNVELFFSIEDEVYNWRYTHSKLSCFRLIEFENDTELVCEKIDVKSKKELSEFLFYTISINYSLYGLNENQKGNYWLKALFHKNDGYQTPIVINPYRVNGNIDVNRELHLGQTRLISNCVIENSNVIVNEKQINKISFHFNYVDEKYFKQYLSTYKINQEKFINDLYFRLFDIKTHIKLENSFEFNYSSYIFNKIIKISEHYSEYYDILKYDNEDVVLKESFDAFIDIIKKDRSHITLKVFQALNVLRFKFLKEINDKTGEFRGEIPMKTLMKRIIKSKKDFFQEDTSRLEELIPLGGISPTIYVNNNEHIDSVNNVDVLSSGEQHYIFSLNSIIYHILNLNSVFNTKEDKIKYRNINIILDEVELYFHPEFQRELVKELTIKLQKLDIENIKNINIILSTHSPFILSDIPSLNILQIGESEEIKHKKNDSFGANVHELLADKFFLKNGTIGSFAAYSIKEMILFYHQVAMADLIKDNVSIIKLQEEYSHYKEKFKFLSENVGEPVFRSVLSNHLQFINSKLRINEED